MRNAESSRYRFLHYFRLALTNHSISLFVSEICPKETNISRQVVASCSLKLMQKAPDRAFCITIYLHLTETLQIM